MRTNDETRRLNMLLAIERAGTAAELAGRIETAPAYLSQIKNRTPAGKAGKPKAMGDDVARRIEEAIDVPSGWMDADHQKEWEDAGLVEATDKAGNGVADGESAAPKVIQMSERTELTRVDAREMRLLTYFRESQERHRAQVENLLIEALRKSKAPASTTASDPTGEREQRPTERLKAVD